jgi:transposase
MGKKNTLKTDYALLLVKQGKTPYAAAKLAGIALSTIYRAIKRNKFSYRDALPRLGATDGT